jgi:hypothetical protein
VGIQVPLDAELVAGRVWSPWRLRHHDPRAARSPVPALGTRRLLGSWAPRSDSAARRENTSVPIPAASASEAVESQHPG